MSAHDNQCVVGDGFIRPLLSLYNLIIPSPKTMYFSCYFLPYNGPKFLQALKSAPSKSEVPKEAQALGLKIFSWRTLCMATGILSMDARVIRSFPICP